MRPFWALLLPAIAGCGSSLEYKVYRYDLDSGEKEAANNAYEQAHPSRRTLGAQLMALRGFSEEVRLYKAQLEELNQLVQVLFGNSDIGTKDAVIEDAFRPLEHQLKLSTQRLSTLQETHGHAGVPSGLHSEMVRLWYAIPELLEAQKVEVDRESLDAVLLSLTAVEDTILQERISNISKRIPTIAKPSLQTMELVISEDRSSIHALFSSAEAEISSTFRRSVAQLRLLQLASGDLVPRTHNVYQDLSDPFLMYIANNPSSWRPLGTDGRVGGDGDTEFILVFEATLDARWKSISVDPTKVISARLRIARRVLGAIVAVAGVALNAYGVPLPKGLGETADTVDYSRMTAEETMLKLKNRAFRSDLEDLRSFAGQQKATLTNENSESLRQQILRRLSGLENR